MTEPGQALRCLGMAFVLGAGLGVLYGFLRPLRPKHTNLADGLFLLGVLWAWLELGFGICRGDLRIGIFLGLPLGAVAWECTAGKLLRGLFVRFWRTAAKPVHLAGKSFKKFCKKMKKIFASEQKMDTI